MKDKKDFKILLIIFIAILIITQISTFIYFNTNINDIRNDITKTNSNIENKDNELQESINQLTETLGLTQKSLTETQLTIVTPEMIEEITKSVVSIKTEKAEGTGFIITDDGYVVTNQHVIFNPGSFINAITSNETEHPLTLIGYNHKLDVALLKISKIEKVVGPWNKKIEETPNESYNALKFASSNNLKVGEKVIAIGNPLGYSSSVTEGIISAISRKIGSTYYDADYIQMDTPVNPGNSGGPLINTEGKVVGLITFGILGADNMGFALESDSIVKTVNEIAMKKLGKTLI